MPEYEAMIDTYSLKLREINDSFDNDIAEYSYPFQDGAALDYMGEKARRITFDCYFYRAQYEQHHEFLRHIRSGNLYELRHPKYGVIKGRISSPSIMHDERKNFAVIRIVFIEQTIGEEITPDTNVVNSVESIYTRGQQENINAAGDGMADIAGDTIDSHDATKKNIDFDSSLLSQFISSGSATRKMMADFDRMLGVIDYWMYEISLPADAVINSIDYGTTVPGRLIGAVAGAVERIIQAECSITSAPSRFAAAVKVALNEFKLAVKNVSENREVYTIVEQSVEISGAQSMSLHVGYMYDDDDINRYIYDKNINLNAFDYNGNKVADVVTIEIFSVNELENSLYMVREALQTAYDYNREHLFSLKEFADILADYVNRVKLERDRIVTIDTGTTIIPVHVLCITNDLSYRYLEKIMAINDIQNPTFACGEIDIYERP